MCGIAGIVSFQGSPPPDEAALRAMCATITHRGPDDEGRDCAGGVALGMRRLSIIDLAGGHQPLFNEDRTVRLVFNGEIYNFRALRTELEARGHRFATHTDGEAVIHAYEEYGIECLRRLNGMYAIALHDLRRRRLYLVRDRIGIKPLYYAFDGSGSTFDAGDVVGRPTGAARHLVFGSEVKTLLASGLLRRELDVDALGEFLAWEYVPAPRTLIRSVRKLPPAAYLAIDLESGRVTSTTYWHVPLPDSTIDGLSIGTASGDSSSGNGRLSAGGGNSLVARGNGRPASPTEDEWLAAVEAKLGEAVRRQLVSDVPLGAFLSGGVDSSLITRFMGAARTFSIGFDDPTYSELPWARRVAEHLGVSHRDEIIRPDVVALFDRLMHFMDDPIGDFSIFPTYLVSRLAREEVTVALSGDGGDELFGGYETYAAQRRARMWQRIPAAVRRGVLEPAIRSARPRAAKKGLVNKAKRFVEGLDHGTALGHARWRLFVGEALRRTLFTTEARAQMPTASGDHIEALFAEAGPRPEIDRSLYVDLKSYLSDNCLTKVDRMSMAVSLEARVPFLDHEVVELAFRMPARLKVRGGQTKVGLKRLAARHVPRECVYRSKQGFSIPIKNWLREVFRPLMEELLSPARLLAEGLFVPEAVAQLTREHLTGTANHSHVLWGLMVFQDWRRRWRV